MGNLGNILPTVLTITTIIGVALAGLQRGIVTNLREANKDLRDRAGDLEKERDEAATEAALHKSDLDALGRMVRNEAELNALSHAIQENHDEVRTFHAETKAFWQVQTDLGKQTLEAIERLSGGN